MDAHRRAAALIDFNVLERELSTIPTPPEPRPIDYAQRHYRELLPDYVTHAEGVSDIGAMSASAVVQMYEQAAQAVEAMGEEQKRVVKRCEEVIAAAHAAAAEAKQVAEHYRDEGKRLFAEIESWSLLTEEVAKTCAAMQKKIVLEVGSGSS